MAQILEQVQPDEEIHHIADKVMREHHKHLDMGDGSYPRLCILWASVSDEDREKGEPAVKCHGYPALAVISIIPYKQRVDKRADAEIIVDKAAWERMNDRQRIALVDHEITHLEVQIDDKGLVKTDDIGRPKLKLRLHDWTVEGFISIARRYGADAHEVINARSFQKAFGADVLEPTEPALFAGH